MIVSARGGPISTRRRLCEWVLVALVLAMIALLPLAVWLDLDDLSRSSLRQQAENISSMMTSIRDYYSRNVVGRMLAARAAGLEGETAVTHNYSDIPGAIPIPATLSIELGRVVSDQQSNISYRFVSDLPFKNRPQHQLDEFERAALAQLRANSARTVSEAARSGFTSSFRLVTPVVMAPACVTCHNLHPESPKTDWKTGDVRGIQEISITQPVAGNILSFKYLLAYYALMTSAGSVFLLMQRRQSRLIHRINGELQVTATRAMAASDAKSNFLASMSHELRTPLNAIIGFSDVMARELFGPLGSARYVGYAGDINGSAQHLLKIINDILDFSKIEAGEMHLEDGVVDIPEVLSFCQRLMQRRATESGLTLRSNVAADVPPVRADERKIKQALLNLLSNAVKFTPPDGLVVVDASVTSGDLALTVSDTGIGIAPEQVDRALEPFAQIDNSLARPYDGTGLGLPLARALVELHAGRLAIDSALGEGTRVTITLPADRLIRG
ncbi:MAG TPA: ATP-binding protein [Alphaproteobacteria bacterium]|nr:ATP-binding protein [Alphaproteobacteria bacterium]